MEQRPSQPHDIYFRSMMSDKRTARDFFERRLPDHIKQVVDLNQLELCKETYIDEDMKKYQVDILYKVNFNDREGYIYSLVEHQSSVDKTMPFRMLKYMVRIMDDHLKNHNVLPIIYPITLYHGKHSYNASTDILDLFDKEDRHLAEYMLLNPCNLIDLTLTDNKHLKGSLLSGIMEVILKNIFAADIYPILKDLTKELQELELLELEILMKLLKYVSIVNIKNAEKVERFINETFVNKEVIVGSLAQKWIDEGIQKGKLEGKLEGRQEGMEAVAINMLRKNIDKEVISEVTGLSLIKLKNLALTL